MFHKSELSETHNQSLAKLLQYNDALTTWEYQVRTIRKDINFFGFNISTNTRQNYVLIEN